VIFVDREASMLDPGMRLEWMRLDPQPKTGRDAPPAQTPIEGQRLLQAQRAAGVKSAGHGHRLGYDVDPLRVIDG
jgi:hypothetical protein